MGNCIETCVQTRQRVEEIGQEGALEKAAGGSGSGDLQLKEKSMGKTETCSSGMRIKIVLTKEELDWLLIQLQNKEGQRLEDVLDEIERGRKRTTVGWKPSLESITECPEVPEQMNR